MPREPPERLKPRQRGMRGWRRPAGAVAQDGSSVPAAAAAGEDASLKRFLNSRVYSHPAIAEERGRSVAALDALFHFFLDHPESMPKHYADLAQSEPRHRIVCDYIAGMTDHFLLRQCHELLGAPATEQS